MSPLSRRSIRVLAAAVLALGGALIAASAVAAPRLRAGRGCYLVGQRVAVSAAGFAPSRTVVVTIDGVFFGTTRTDGGGRFSGSLLPGGLGAGTAQHVDTLGASDGTVTAGAQFTLTRRAGARVLASRGNPKTLRAPFEVWGFALNGRPRPLYLHYAQSKTVARATLLLGHSGGQCGYLRTGPRRVFPFSPAPGLWLLQIDTHKRYAFRTSGPVARIIVGVR